MSEIKRKREDDKMIELKISLNEMISEKNHFYKKKQIFKKSSNHEYQISYYGIVWGYF